MDRIFEGACRKLGLKRVQYKKREVCFKIKAMGLTGKPVDGIGRESANCAVDELVKIWHKEDSLNVVLIISASKGLRIKDKKGNELFSYKIYNVANCTVDKENPEVFLFIARQRDNTNSCHAFYCSDKFQAEAICLSMSNAFHKAFEAWVKRNGMPPTSADGAVEAHEHNGNDVFSDDAIKKQQLGEIDKELSASKCVAPAKRNFENGRRPSTLSEGSTFSFSSQADEAFSTLLSVTEEEEDLSNVALLRKDSYDWDAAEDNQKVLSLIEGEDIVWEQDTDC